MSELVRGSAERQRRVAVLTGVAATAVVGLTVVVIASLPQSRPATAVDIVLSTPSVGQGIDGSSKVLLHGVVVGSISTMDRHGERADLRIRLDRNKITGLTDSFGFDFRPQNTFGVSALSLTPRDGGRPLTDGLRIERSPDANATMSQMLSGQIAFVNGVITDDLVQMIRRASDYTTALAPLVETGFVLANQIAETQRDTSAELLHKFNSVLEPTPDVVDSLFWSIDNLRYFKGWEEAVTRYQPLRATLDLLGTGFFGPAGDLLGRHRADFTPATEIIRSFADAISTMVQRSRGALSANLG